MFTWYVKCLFRVLFYLHCCIAADEKKPFLVHPSAFFLPFTKQKIVLQIKNKQANVRECMYTQQNSNFSCSHASDASIE